MGVTHVLRDDEAWLLLDFSFLSNNFDSFATTESSRLHNVHVFVTVDFSLRLELSVVLWEHVGPRTEVERVILMLHALHIFPHEIFTAYLVRLREMIDLLVFSSIA